MANIYEKFNEMFDTKGLADDVKAVAEKAPNAERVEVPDGTYEVKIEKMELKESKNGKPMVSIWFKILVGEFKNSMIFMNQVIAEQYGVHNSNQFLRSLKSGVDVKFEDFKQYHFMLMDIHEAINKKLEYALEYGTNSNGYHTYKITEVFEVE